MKKTSSFNLEKDIYDEIEMYKAKYNLSSRNIALERMLLERRMLMNLNSNEQIQVTNVEKVITNNSKENPLKHSLKDSFDNMPD